MNKRIMFRHMDRSEPMSEHIDKQLHKIEKFLERERTPIHLDMVLEPSKTREHHCIELKVTTADYEAFCKREYSGEAFYKELDSVIDTVYRQLLEQKRRHHDDQVRKARHDDPKNS